MWCAEHITGSSGLGGVAVGKKQTAEAAETDLKVTKLIHFGKQVNTAILWTTLCLLSVIPLTPHECCPTPFPLSLQYIYQWRAVRHQISEGKSAEWQRKQLCLRVHGGRKLCRYLHSMETMTCCWLHITSAWECMKSWVLKWFSYPNKIHLK